MVFLISLNTSGMEVSKHFQGPFRPLVLKGLAMIFAGHENPLIIFRSKEIYIYFKTNNKIPINLLKF